MKFDVRLCDCALAAPILYHVIQFYYQLSTILKCQRAMHNAYVSCLEVKFISWSFRLKFEIVGQQWI